jgi:hypothetical protein
MESNSPSKSVPETATQIADNVDSCTSAVGSDKKNKACLAGFRKFASPSSTHQRDFMPYIRRAAERKLLQPQVLWMSLLCKAEAECLLDVPSSLLCEDYACWMLRIPEAEHGAADSAALAGEGGTIPVPHFSTQLHQGMNYEAP